VTQVIASAASNTLALVAYPGLVTLVAVGVVIEALWSAVSRGSQVLPVFRFGRPQIVHVAVALLATLAVVQTGAPFNPVAPIDRNVVIAVAALGFTAWAELALDAELVATPGLMLVIQACWVLAVLGPAIEPQSLRPQVLGNVLVPSLIPVKVAAAFLYLLCLPPLLRLWPVAPPADRRARPRFNTTRALVWFPYCALFVTLFFPPQTDDIAGLARFAGLVAATAGVCIAGGALLGMRGAERARGLYSRVVTPYSLLVLLLVIGTLILSH
jgi:hypothetical protein